MTVLLSPGEGDTGSDPESIDTFEVVVVGAGMSGIGAGHYLGAAGISYCILEAKDDLGGVWHSHRWHGARCDSDFVKYSFSFSPFLSRECFQDSATIQQYLRRVAWQDDILPKIRFRTRVQKAVFHCTSHRWAVHTNNGVLHARFLFNGNGYFSDEPYVPALPDIERFRGELIHAAHLDGSRRFFGRRVVVVGSGATAICCAPALAQVAGSVVLLQHSPSYIYESSNRAGLLVRGCQALYRVGLRMPLHALRHYLQLRDDAIFVAFRRFPGPARWFFRRHWIKALGKNAFAAHFRPRYNPWEQRIPVATGLTAMLRDGRMTIHTGTIERFTSTSIVLRGGNSIDCDVCVLATGLNLRFFSFGLYVGEERIALERINFHRGLLVGGIPNYFHPMGSWHSAWTQRSEPLTRLAIRIIKYMHAHGHSMVSVPRREVACRPGITPNYVLRSLDTMPRLEGTFDLPSLDNLFTCRFDARRYRFS